MRTNLDAGTYTVEVISRNITDDGASTGKITGLAKKTVIVK